MRTHRRTSEGPRSRTSRRPRRLRIQAVATLAACAMALSMTVVARAGVSTGNAGIRELTNVGGRVFFSARDGANDRELWISEGTAATTERVKDINLAGSSDPQELTDVAGTLFFAAEDGTGRNLWKSDGTELGTQLVLAIPGYITDLTNVNGTLFFRVIDGGSHLWKSNGTAVGTELVETLPSGDHFDFEAAGSRLYFVRALDNQVDTALWKSDGTAEGTRFVKHFADTQFVRLTGVGTRLFILKQVGDTGHFPVPTALWKSNGTRAGTKLIRDLVPEQDDYAYDIIDANGTAYLHALNGLWKSDSTFAGTVRLTDRPVSYVHTKTYIGGNVYFTVRTGETTTDLWKSDGTAAGTEFVSAAAPYRCLTLPFEPCTINQRWREAGVAGVYYFASDHGTRGIELWRSSGSAAGTQRVKDIRPGAASSAPSDLTKSGGLLYFVANDGMHGRELWVSDGSPAGTTMVMDINDA